MIEVELKAWLTDLAETRAAVEREGATLEGEFRKQDHYYGPGKKAAREVDFARDPIFRLRTVGRKAWVSAKRREAAEDGVDVNREIEFEIEDVASFREFARHIGFRPFIVKRRKTRAYTLGRATVEIHEIDPLGDFIEIEILVADESEVEEAREEVLALLERFGVPQSRIEPRLYIDLLRARDAGRPEEGGD